ncbi:unnamed protein product [Ceratitis capitata]|uniref:(Mediterranean fruit fly) hypothetical protein n=1 Tax=Ceratitis capitata TaxID=7213 RepID=A0A811V4M6_CERCA|nr:unnamed protein product [Ceratitis capitata]
MRLKGAKLLCAQHFKSIKFIAAKQKKQKLGAAQLDLAQTAVSLSNFTRERRIKNGCICQRNTYVCAYVCNISTNLAPSFVGMCVLYVERKVLTKAAILSFINTFAFLFHIVAVAVC